MTASWRRVSAVGLVVVLLLAMTATVAAAQSGGDKVVMGGNYTLPANQALNSRLIVLGGNATLEPNSTVAGDVTVMGGNLQADGRIAGDIAVFGGSVALGNTAVVEGSIHSWGGSVQRASGAQVRGTVQEGPAQLTPRLPTLPTAPRPLLNGLPTDLGARSPVNTVLGWIVRFFTALLLGFLLAVVGLVVVLVVPRQTAEVAAAMSAQPAVSFAVGLLTLIVAILLSFVLVWLCGLGLLVLMLAAVALVFGWVAAGLWLGERLLQVLKVRGSTNLTAAALGVFLITWLAVILPSPWWCCLGWLFTLVLGATGVGAVVLTRFGTQPAGSISGWTGSGGAGGSGGYGGLTPTGADATLRGEQAPGSGASQADQPSDRIESDILVEDRLGPLERGVQPAAAIVAGSSATASQPGLLEHLEAIHGITPQIAGLLRQSGHTTLVAVATSDPETLAGATGVDAERIRQEDWIGQARLLLS